MIAEAHFAGRQCLGKRALQEDAYAFSEIGLEGADAASAAAAKGLLLVVADGMGGHAAGSRASELAVRMFVATFHRGGATIAARFAAALQVANTAISEAIDANPDELEGMGTTLVAAALTPAGLEWISVGDSPLFLWRGGELRRLNADHSFRPVLREMIASGKLTPGQAATSSLRNRLRAALIGSEIALTDASAAPLPLLPGDVVLAASDGVQTLDDVALAAALAASTAEDAAALATRLLRGVLDAEKPKQDNATVAIVQPPPEWFGTPAADATPARDEIPTRRVPPRIDPPPRAAAP